MDLRDFVKSTLISIVSGVNDASQALKEKTNGVKRFKISSMGERGFENQYINFDVAVVTSSEVKGQVSSEGKILVASIDLEGSASGRNENVSRVNFRVFCDYSG
jgi:hypothetical protein